MSWGTRIVNVFRSAKRNVEIDAELRFHLAERADDLADGGMPREEARRQAARKFGNYASLKERTGDMDISRRAESLVSDLRYGLRQLRLNPGFTSVAVLSLALGIGANSAMFQLLNAVRLRPLPVADPAAMVVVTQAPSFFSSGWAQGRNELFTFAQVEEVSRRQQAFTGMLAFGTRRFNLSDGGTVRFAEGLYISPNFLEVLGVAPQLGSWPAGTDPRDCGHEGVLLNDGFWRREFGGDPGVIGRTMTLEGRRLPIHAVAPASFYGVEPAYRFDVAVPLCTDAARDGAGRLGLKWAWWLTMMGRLKPGWTIDAASRHLHEMSPSVFQATVPDNYRPEAAASYLKNRFGVASAQSGVSFMRREYEGALWILLGMTSLVLLIACANLANLLLARAAAREREAVLRLALGASRGRLVRQLMAESGLLAVGGGLLGAWLAHALSRAMVAFLGGQDDTIYLPMDVDWRVLAFTTTVGLGTCLLFGLGPALRATRVAPAMVMHGGRGSASLADRHTLRRGLVVSQIALSFVLLAGALLFGQTLRNLRTTDTGMVTEGVLGASLTTDVDESRRPLMFQEIEARVRRLPDVAAVATVRYRPFGGAGWNEDVYVGEDAAKTTLTWFNRASPRYFETMGTPLLAGRDFSSQDRAGAPNVAIVNQAFARSFFGDADPIGRRFRFQAGAGQSDPVFTIVGLGANTKYGGLRENLRLIAFLPVAQDTPMPDQVSLVLRARGAPGSAMAGVEREIIAVDPRMQVEFDALDELIAESLVRERLVANLSGGFGLLAVVLATLGLYGVMSYIIARRRAEIGVRMALGARRGDILALVLRESGRLVVFGLVLGLAGAVLSLRSAESLLFGLAPTDAPSFALAAGLLAATAFVAVLVPARRAANTDAAVILRGD